MVTRVATIAFEGIEARPVDVQVLVSSGNVVFNIVGLPDKTVGESRERVRAALIASGLSLPAKRITVNLAPADLPKEGSHYDLPIALGVMAAIGAIPSDALEGYVVVGELALDGSILPIAGVLPAAMHANARNLGLICPQAGGPEAAWASSELDIVAPRSLIQLANHVTGAQALSRPEPAVRRSLAPLRRPQGGEGPGERQARAGDRGGGRPQSADERAARRRQVDARGAPALDPAAAFAEGAPRSLDDPFGGGADRRWRAHGSAALSRAASFGLDGGARRRRHACAAGRGVARASRRALPRRIPGILPASGARKAQAKRKGANAH